MLSVSCERSSTPGLGFFTLMPEAIQLLSGVSRRSCSDRLSIGCGGHSGTLTSILSLPLWSRPFPVTMRVTSDSMYVMLCLSDLPLLEDDDLPLLEDDLAALGFSTTRSEASATSTSKARWAPDATPLSVCSLALYDPSRSCKDLPSQPGSSAAHAQHTRTATSGAITPCASRKTPASVCAMTRSAPARVAQRTQHCRRGRRAVWVTVQLELWDRGQCGTRLTHGSNHARHTRPA
jgi:hypothetical protein